MLASFGLSLALATAPEKRSAVASSKLEARGPSQQAAVPAKAAPATPVGKSDKTEAAAKKVASLAKISPPLHTGSDKKFFGPPFPANYHEDKRPVPEKSILDKVRGPDQAYPALQGHDEYDRDYVKDENSDHGDWKAQFEYDLLRNKLRKERGDASRSKHWTEKEFNDVDDAQRNADKAGRDVDSAQKDLDDAKAGEESSKHDPDDWSGPPSHEKLDKLKAAVADAEKNYEKEKKEFEECKKNLEESKKILDDLKAKQVEMEKQLASETKLWVETKTVRLNAKKAKEEAAHAKTLAAHEHLKVVQGEKAAVDKILSDKKAEHAKALKNLDKKKADVAQAQKELAQATLTLQKIRGIAPQAPKSGAAMSSNMLAFLALAVLAAARV